jgi:hypothetical protein
MSDMRANIFQLLKRLPVLAMIVNTTAAGLFGQLDSRLPAF